MLQQTLRATFCDRAFWLKQVLFRRRSYEYYQQLMRNQFLSRDEILDINWRKRKQLLRDVWEQVPYYSRKFQSLGLSPSDIREPDDWRHVPLLTRKDLVEHFSDLISPSYGDRDRAISSTGGSTGEPVKVYHDLRVAVEALGWRVLSWLNVSPGCDVGYIRRLPTDSMLRRAANRLMWWPTTRLRLDASSMTESGVRTFIEQFNRSRPPLLQGYVGAITHLADFAESHSLRVHSPQAVWVTSAPIATVQRSLIERVFQAPVYDQYGCCEVFWLAAECSERDGLHVCSDARHVEFLREDNEPCEPEQDGRIVITDLENRVFPLIRYENGDHGRPLARGCNCGVNLPLMGPVKGRVAHCMRLPGGTVISGEYLTTIFDEFPTAVRAFQVVQQEDWSLLVRVVPSDDKQCFSRAIEQVKKTLAEKTNHRVAIATQCVSEIPDDRGKLVFVVSHARGTPPP